MPLLAEIIKRKDEKEMVLKNIEWYYKNTEPQCRKIKNFRNKKQ